MPIDLERRFAAGGNRLCEPQRCNRTVEPGDARTGRLVAAAAARARRRQIDVLAIDPGVWNRVAPRKLIGAETRTCHPQWSKDVLVHVLVIALPCDLTNQVTQKRIG